MQSANGGHDGRYLPAGMDYTGMAHHPHHPHHHLSSVPDPHSGLHYSLPPGAMSSATGLPSHHQLGSKRLSDMDMMGSGGNVSSDEDGSMDIKPSLSDRGGTGRGAPLKSGSDGPPTGKKTKGRVKIKMEFIDNKLRRYTTFSKRKTGIMKKAYELSTLTGTQVMLLVASETGHVYTFATRKLQPMITSDAGKALIQTCLNSPDPPPSASSSDQRMSVSGYEETELTYNVADAENQEKVRQMMYNSHYSPAAALAAAAHHSHNLFPPTGGPPTGHLTPSSHSGGMSVTSSMSPFPGHPAPSPSPSHHPPPHSYNISPSLSHSPGSGGQQHLVSSHSPPFLPHGQHPSAR